MTCASLVERGTPAASDTHPMSTAATQPGAVVATSLPHLLPDCSDGQAYPGVHCTQLLLHTWYHDPVPCPAPLVGAPPDGCVHVNDVYTQLSWNWDGHTICTPPADINEAESVYVPFYPTGWDVTSHSEDTQLVAPAACSQVHNLSTATFTNRAFCPLALAPLIGVPGALGLSLFDPTVTNYAPVGLYGYPDGTGQLSITVGASGSCQDLLSFNYSLTQVVDGQPVM